MKAVLALTTVPMLTAVARAQTPVQRPLEAVAGMEVSRHMGTWYEVAGLPFRFQDQCVGDVTATYVAKPGCSTFSRR